SAGRVADGEPREAWVGVHRRLQLSHPQRVPGMVVLLVERIGAAGRAAFTNYLGTSILMTTLFYGYGLGLFGSMSRVELWLVVLPTWALMLLWSKPWLDRFRYGPLEWLWRSLARGRLEPIRRALPATRTRAA
ncbi:MAG: DUF418 domain-containing protein, partial [Pseudomonadota bacterium]|nr:DUF418 domain-containing protein [Pseudomonadota bacterium]